MKVVFLDIDGVLISRRSLLKQAGRPIPGTNRERMLAAIDPEVIARLNMLTEKSGVVYVLSSIWRKSDPLTLIQSVFNEKGFTGSFLATTPNYYGKTTNQTHRGLEIQKWLDMLGPKNQPESFVIIDDSSDMAHLMAHLVLVSNEYGLIDENVNQALEILSK